MPSLAEALANQTPRNGGLTCTVCDLIATLNKDDANALNEALDNPRLTATMIVRALEDYGSPIPVGTIRRHRRKECATLRNVG
jgi:hypothetical protein